MNTTEKKTQQFRNADVQLWRRAKAAAAAAGKTITAWVEDVIRERLDGNKS